MKTSARALDFLQACDAELSGTVLLILPAVAPDKCEGFLLQELWRQCDFG